MLSRQWFLHLDTWVFGINHESQTQNYVEFIYISYILCHLSQHYVPTPEHN